MEQERIQELVSEAQQGDENAFGKLYDEFARPIFRFVYFRVGHQETAEDLTADIFVKAWQKISSYKPEKNVQFSTWLYTVARNSIIDYYRSNKTPVNIEVINEVRHELYSENGFVEARLDLERLNTLIASLKPKYAMAIDLRYFQGLEDDEIARIMDIKQGNVRVVIHRAVKQIQELIDHE